MEGKGITWNIVVTVIRGILLRQAIIAAATGVGAIGVGGANAAYGGSEMAKQFANFTTLKPDDVANMAFLTDRQKDLLMSVADRSAVDPAAIVNGFGISDIPDEVIDGAASVAHAVGQFLLIILGVG